MFLCLGPVDDTHNAIILTLVNDRANFKLALFWISNECLLDLECFSIRRKKLVVDAFLNINTGCSKANLARVVYDGIHAPVPPKVSLVAMTEVHRK